MARAEKRPLSLRTKILATLAICVIGGGIQSLHKWSETHALMINATDSLPNWAFLVESGNFPKRGDYVIFHPGYDALTTEYFGDEPEAFAKVAYGVPGDKITRRDGSVFVNGERIVSLKPLTRRGDPLAEGPTGTVPDGCVFAATKHKDGFDSRYEHIGFVCRDRLVGTGRAIL